MGDTAPAENDDGEERRMRLNSTDNDSETLEGLQDMARNCRYQAMVLRACALSLESMASDFEADAATKGSSRKLTAETRSRSEKARAAADMALTEVFGLIDPLAEITSGDPKWKREIRKAKKFLRSPATVVTAGIPCLYPIQAAHRLIQEAKKGNASPARRRK